MKQCVSLFLLVVLTGIVYSGNLPDISGSWVIDETQEYVPTRLTLIKVEIEQTADSLKLTRHYRDPRNEMVILNEALPFDGNPFEMEYQGIPRKSLIQRGATNDAVTIKIVVTMMRNNETREGVTLETWKLTDHNTLTLTRVSPSIPDDTPLVYVYNREKH